VIKLADRGFSVGDLVTFDSDEESTGGVIFQIAVNFDSPIPEGSRRYGAQHVHPETGKPLKPMEVEGYLRLKPLFSFFPTSRGKKPKGAGATVLVYHRQLQWMRKIELLELATRYAELGNIIRDVARQGGMEG